MPNSSVYTGKRCQKCSRPLTVVPGAGSTELQMQKVVCETCACKSVEGRAQEAYERRQRGLGTEYQRRRRASLRAGAVERIGT